MRILRLEAFWLCSVVPIGPLKGMETQPMMKQWSGHRVRYHLHGIRDFSILGRLYWITRSLIYLHISNNVLLSHMSHEHRVVWFCSYDYSDWKWQTCFKKKKKVLISVNHSSSKCQRNLLAHGENMRNVTQTRIKPGCEARNLWDESSSCYHHVKGLSKTLQGFGTDQLRRAPKL